MITAIRNRLQDDRGVIGGADALLFGLIGLVFTSLAITNAWIAIDTSLAVSAAAREGARAAAEAPPDMVVTNAESAMQTVMTQYGRDLADFTMTVELPAGGIARCAPITTSANYQINLLALPFFGDLGTHTIGATHTEIIDPFRSSPLQDSVCG